MTGCKSESPLSNENEQKEKLSFNNTFGVYMSCEQIDDYVMGKYNITNMPPSCAIQNGYREYQMSWKYDGDIMYMGFTIEHTLEPKRCYRSVIYSRGNTLQYMVKDMIKLNETTYYNDFIISEITRQHDWWVLTSKPIGT